MAPFSLTHSKKHPYPEIWPETHGHVAPTCFVPPNYSAACISFGWILRLNVEGSAHHGEMGLAGGLAQTFRHVCGIFGCNMQSHKRLRCFWKCNL